MPTVLGVDPGEQTGVAVVRVGPQAPFILTHAKALPARLFPEYVRELLQTSAVDVVAIEQYQFFGGPRGRKGTSQAAYAVGRTIGALEALGLTNWVAVTRPEVLRALGLAGNASKASCREVVRMLTTGHNDARGFGSSHVWDAAAVAIGAAGRAEAVA